MKLTPAQDEAINCSVGNLQLIACAGSGKTEVVARRVVRLLDPQNAEALAPRQIVAFTFTDKAAAELKERTFTRCRQALGEIPGMAEMFVGTIHAFCLELLKTDVPKYLKFEVLNEVQQGLFADRHCKQSGLTTSTDINGNPLTRYKDTKHYLTALSILQECDRIDTALEAMRIVSPAALIEKLDPAVETVEQSGSSRHFCAQDREPHHLRLGGAQSGYWA